MISSGYNFNDKRKYDFSIFPNDSKFGYVTIFSIALADALVNNTSFELKLNEYRQLYPSGNFGGVFSRRAGHNNLTLAAAQTVIIPLIISPIGWFSETLEDALLKTEKYINLFEHTSEEAQLSKVISAVIYLAKNGYDKNLIEEFVESYFGFILTDNPLIKEKNTNRIYNPFIHNTLKIFIESDSFEDCISKSLALEDHFSILISSASIAEAFYGSIPKDYKEIILTKLNPDLRKVLLKFIRNFCFI